jgi:diguanylate cyclase (GGDEF)-like protein/PAS domain S-box-containing protein
MNNFIAATAENEAGRLQALHDLEILDSEREPEFDELVALASAICETPISVVSMVDQDRQWFKAQVGLEVRETPRAVAFCSHAIAKPDLMIVEDAQQDERFAKNPIVTGGPKVRFYAGVPVTAPDGHALGTLCVIDSKPKTLTKGQMAALKILASQVNVKLELRLHRRKLERALREAEEAREKLHASEERFRLFMDNSPLVSHIKDEQGRLIFYNQVFAERFNISGEEWIGVPPNELWPDEEVKLMMEADREVLAGKTLRAIFQTVHERNGGVSYWKSYKFPLVNNEGMRFVGVVGVEITDELRREEELEISQKELREANHRLQNLVLTDALTGLYNRRGFDERLNAEFARAGRKNHDLSVLLIDLDNFKRRNDTYGHPEGDKTLKQLAKIMQATCRLGDLAARYGGEEFVMLLPETNEQQAIAFANRLLDAIRKAEWDNEPVTASMGIASLHPSTKTEQRLVALADEALYVAKRFGKNRAVAYGDYFKQVLQDLQPEATSVEERLAAD